MEKTTIGRKLEEVFGLDLRSLALFRIGLALVIIADLTIRSQDLNIFYSNAGVLPREALTKITSPLYWSIHSLSGQVWFEGIVFIAAITIAVLMLIGYRTRLATIATWALVISLHNRNPTLIFAADDVLRAIMFWAMFLPLGACYSVDAALNTSTKPQPKRYVAIATVALMVQQCYIYMFSAGFKHQSPLWSQEGSAVYYALSFDQYATPIGQLLLKLPPDLLKLMTFGALYFEWLAPLIIFIPFRNSLFKLITFVSFVCLHISFGLCFELGIFPYLSVATWFAFLPSQVWDYLAKRNQNKQRDGLRIYYDLDCGFCKKVVRFLRTFLILPHTLLLSAQEAEDTTIYRDMEEMNSWVVIDWEGKRRFKWDAIAYVVGLSPILFPLERLLRIPVLMSLGTKFYQIIASNRRTAGYFTKPFKYTNFQVTSESWRNIVAGIFLVLMTFWNLTSFAQNRLLKDTDDSFYKSLQKITKSRTAQSIEWLGEITRLNQSWSIFAPHPPRDDGWHIIIATLNNGQEIDLLTSNTPKWEKPTMGERNRLYKNMQWRTYFINLNRAIGKRLFPYYGAYLCRQWDSQHQSAEQIKKLDIYFIEERTVPQGETQNTVKTNPWSGNCVDIPQDNQ
jgi:predicted DCC family thiol-disulfide oxidoreductase YuxK